MTQRLTAPTAAEQVLDGSGRLTPIWFGWVTRATRLMQGREPVRVAEYTMATLPDADGWRGAVVMVSDEAGGYCLAYSDGAIWRRAYDNTEVAS